MDQQVSPKQKVPNFAKNHLPFAGSGHHKFAGNRTTSGLPCQARRKRAFGNRPGTDTRGSASRRQLGQDAPECEARSNCHVRCVRIWETGGIVADALGLRTYTSPGDDIAGLIDALTFEHDEDTVLVVAHAETMPRILEGLGLPQDITIGLSEFANLFVVLTPLSNDPQVLHFLRF
nr:hypothetical protein [Ruegeria marina]